MLAQEKTPTRTFRARRVRFQGLRLPKMRARDTISSKSMNTQHLTGSVRRRTRLCLASGVVNVKLKDLIERFVDEMNGADGERPVKALGTSHLYCLRRLQRAPIAQKEASELKKSDIIEHVKARRAEGISAATAQHDVTFLRGVLQYAPSAWDDCEDVSAAAIRSEE